MKKGSLKYWMERATHEDRVALAALAGTSSEYLFGQLGNGHRENPKLRLALNIVQASQKLRDKSGDALPEITLKGLAWPNK